MRYSVVLLVFLLVACSSPKEPKEVRLMGEAQGTYYSIIYYDTMARDFQYEIDSLLDAFDRSVSLWVPNSLINQVNQGKGSIVLDRHFTDNFKLAKQVSEETEGAFDFTVGSLAKAWGFGSDGVKNVDASMVDSLLQWVGYDKVRLLKGEVFKESRQICFDFNAIAQGYSVDVVGDFLTSQGIDNYLIDVGGEVKGKGNKPEGDFWKVGIEKPAEDQNSERALSAVIGLDNTSIATSGNYRKYYEENGIRYSHTIDPKTGYPARQNLLSATIMCDSTAFADAYATACMVMGLDRSLEFVEAHPQLEGFFIYSTAEGYSSVATEGFKQKVTRWFEE